MMRRLVLSLAVCCCLRAAVRAEEGMWLFNAPPKAQIKKAYDFELTEPWLDHLRLSSVRVGKGGSGAFVSADGLLLTNHHVASACLHGLSSAQHDYYTNGFYAKHRDRELRCPDLEIVVLEQITDVTNKINAAAKSGVPSEVAKAQRVAMAAIEKECASAPGMRCDVVTLYSGARYHLYSYKKYTDLRLVFAPESEMAFFGGDPDNFEFPRYDLDITVFRVYENNHPVHLENYLHWSRHGAQKGDLVFVSGHPGSTARLYALNQLEFMRTKQYPLLLEDLHRRIALLHAFAAQSPESARIAQEDIFRLENSFKAISGYKAALDDAGLMRARIIQERRELIMASRIPRRRMVIHCYAEIDKALAEHARILLPYRFLELRAGFRGQLASFARDLVRLAAEKEKPNGERLREYRDSALPSLEQELFSTSPVYKALETAELTDSLQEMQKQLGAADPVVQRVLNGKSPQATAQYLISNTHLDDVSFRQQLYAGGTQAIAASSDPLIAMMRDVDPDVRAVRSQYDDKVEAVIHQNATLINRERYSMGNANQSPDATFTLRLSYGTVKGYVEDGRGELSKGTTVDPFTDMEGAFTHAEQHGNQPPYQLPASWIKNKSKLDLKAPFNFVSTADIIGGSSGSPVVNRAGELVGVIFDGNMQSLPWNFLYDDKVGRAISVDARAIQQALRKLYHAKKLANELLKGHE